MHLALKEVPVAADKPRSSRIAPTAHCALVTGAASGIGRAFAQYLAARGDNLILVDRESIPLRRLASELRQRHQIVVECAVLDLTTPEAPLSLLRFCHRRRLRVSMLVNNAGVGFRSTFAKQRLAAVTQTLDVNVGAVVRLTRAFLPRMLRRGTGSIVNVGSIAGFTPSPTTAMYAASKAFVLSFTESLAKETAGTGVHVANLCPGLTDTPLLDRFGLTGSTGAQTPQEVVEEAMAGIERRRHLIVTGTGNRVRIWAQQMSLRSLLRFVLDRARKVRGWVLCPCVNRNTC